MDACIKNVNPETWKKFKSEAIKHEEPMGKFLDVLIAEHMAMEKKAKNFWVYLESGKKSLSDKDVEKIEEVSRSFREKFDCE